MSSPKSLESSTVKDGCKRFALSEQDSKNASTSSAKNVAQNNTSETEISSRSSNPEVKGLSLPPGFATYSSNHNEKWQPALFVKERSQLTRVCHYAKSDVYLPICDMEYSPEEIKARRHKYHSEAALKKQLAQMVNDNIQRNRLFDTYEQQQEQGKLQSTDQENNVCEVNNDQSEDADNSDMDIVSDSEDENNITINHNEGLNNTMSNTDNQQYISSQSTANDENPIDIDMKEPEPHSTRTNNLHNKNIKIVFKKDCSTDRCEASNAYQIESIRIPENDAKAVPGSERQNVAHNSTNPCSSTSTRKPTLKREQSKSGTSSRSLNSASISSSIIFQNITSENNTNSTIINRSRTSGRGNTLTITNISLTFDEDSFFNQQRDIDLSIALETINSHMAKEALDPFNSELCRAFLTKLNFPKVHYSRYTTYKISMQTYLSKIEQNRHFEPYPGVRFYVDKEIRRASYGSIYKATDLSTGKVMALKLRKPANKWEIYICDQISKRIKSVRILFGLMTISTALIARNASIIATDFSYFGSLLDINNKLRQTTKKAMHESLIMHFLAQICDIIYHLHRIQIIHTDIKPDNFLLMRVPATTAPFPSLRLIDFGCAIDMTLFPKGNDTKFRKEIQTDGFKCIEMLEGKSWSYETDFFGIAATVHVMLFGEYMTLRKQDNVWDINQRYPRYLNKHIWSDFFNKLLNIKPGGKELPDLNALCRTFQEESLKTELQLEKHIRTLTNLLYR